MYVGCACLVAILDDGIDHSVSVLVSVVKHV